MRITFTKEELEIIKKAGISFDATKDLDSDAVFEIDEQISEYLIYEGIEEDERLNKEGKICERILEKLSDE